MRIRVFKQPQILQQMLLLRMAGMEYKQIAIIFQCDFSSVYHHCKKYNIKPSSTILISPYLLSMVSKRPEDEILEQIRKLKEVIPTTPKESQWYTDSNGERFNKGFNYKDYLRNHST